MSDSATTRYRICPLCEATCGLELQTEGRVVTAVRGDVDDVFSLGFICPKGAALKELDADPDRLREPLVRRDGRLVPVGWDEAFAEIERRLIPILEEHGKDSLATYLGNPSVHNADLAIYYQVLATVLPSRNRFTASTVDQIPKHVSCGLMFGGYLSIPIPDIDRCDYLLMRARADLAASVHDALPGHGVSVGQGVQRVAHLARVARDAGQLCDLSIGCHAPERDPLHESIDARIEGIRVRCFR